MESCANCKFFYHDKDDKQDACRRFPPTAQVLIVPRANQIARQIVPVEETRSLYPMVKSDWWCGEYVVQIGTA